MPSNNTVSTGDYSSMYLEQAQKYIDKCTSGNKELSVMQGDHGFVLKTPDAVAAKIHAFFSPLF